MWDERFKNPPSSYGDLFVLVCVHGSASGVVRWGEHPSQAAQIPSRRRIELHPNTSGGLCMSFSSEEISDVVRAWTRCHAPPCDDLIEYLKFETQGHVGMLELVLQHLKGKASDNHVLPLSSLQYHELTSNFPGRPSSSKFYPMGWCIVSSILI